MTETLITLKKEGISGLAEVKPLIKITGTLTSQIQLKGEGTPEPYYYSFIRLKGQSIDLPVIFKVKDEQENLTKPSLKKSEAVELTGHYSNSSQNVRKSFTCSDYQLLNHQRIRKKCSGCLDTFTCYKSKNYDYCSACELNGSRYLNKVSPCSECDGSGLIKFPNQPPRSCKICYLKKKEILEQAKSQLPELEKEAESITQIRQQLEKND